MDVAQILRQLWRQRTWLVVGLAVAVAVGLVTAYRPGLVPPKLEKRALELGAAQTEVAVDSPRSALLDVSGESLGPLIARAQLYSRLMGTPPVRRLIAEEAGIPYAALTSGSARATDPTSEQRANDILKDDRSFKIFFQVGREEPLITISTQGPTAKEAIRLADAAASGFAKYLRREQIKQGVSTSLRAQVRQLGPASGGVVNSGANGIVAILAGLAAFIGFCLLILLVTGLRRDLKAAAEADVVQFGRPLRTPETDRPWGPRASDGGASSGRRSFPRQ